MSSRRSARAARRSGVAAKAAPTVRQRSLQRSLLTAIRQRPWLFALGLAAVHLVLAGLSFMPTPHTGGDNASYIALARSLLERNAYLEIYDPAAPPHTQYPPVFPGLLAIALLIGLEPWVQLKAIIALCAAAGVALTFLWIRRRRRPLLALGVGVLLAIGPGLLELGHWILSDVPFWMFTMLALFAFERLKPDDRVGLALAVLATTLAYFTRSAGLPLAIAAFSWLALRHRWSQLIVLAAVLLPLAFLWWLRARGQGGVDYVGQFWMVDPYDPARGRVDVAGLFARAGDNAVKYLRIHMPVLLTGSASGFSIGLGIGVLSAGVYGWLARIRRPGVAELFLPLYLGLLIAWPAVWSGERFLLPAFPLILYHAGDGIARIARRVTPRAAFAVGAVALAGIVAAQAPGVREQVRTGTFCTAQYRAGDPFPCLAPQWRDYFEMATWAGGALPANAAVVTRKPRLWYGLSGRPAIIYPFTERTDSLFAVAQAAGTRYLVIDYVDGLTQAYVVPAVLRRAGAFCLMHVMSTGTALLGIDANAASMSETEPPTGGTTFPICAEPYWANPADREAAAQRLGVTR